MASESLEQYFKKWYDDVWLPWVPPRSFWHFYRFQKFDGEWYQLRDNVRTQGDLKKIVHKYSWSPKHVYYSVLRWLHPQKVGTIKERKYCLGGPLVFDLDIVNEISNRSLAESKNHLLMFVYFLEHEFQFRDFSFVFSGRKGFHVYVNDFEPSEFSSLSKEHYREQIESDARRRIAEIVYNKGHKIDMNVTMDTRRIIRLPTTLHGETALRCSFIGSKPVDIERFRMESCLAFPVKEEICMRLTRDVPRVCFIDEYFGPYQKKLKTMLPMHFALYLACSGFAEIV